MTKRQSAIREAILDAMHNLDGAQVNEITVHADANLLFRVMIPKNEFDEAFADLNSRGAFIGIKTEFKGTLWSLSARGQQIRAEMK